MSLLLSPLFASADRERFVLALALMAPAAIMVLGVLLVVRTKRGAAARTRRDLRLPALLAGFAAAYVLLAVLLGPPLRAVYHGVSLPRLAADTLVLGGAALAAAALAAGFLLAVARRRSITAAALCLLAPVTAALLFLGVQWATEAATVVPVSSWGHSADVAVIDSAIIETVAPGLNVPGALASDSEGRLLFGEVFTGRLALIDLAAGTAVRTIGRVPLPAGTRGEQGLWDIALDPSGAYLYAMAIHTVSATGDSCCDTSRIIRFPYYRGDLGPLETVVSGLPAGKQHSGGALAFGPDRSLCFTIGDLGQTHRVFAARSLEGSVMRIAPDGSIPKDNPFPLSPVYAYGFRNAFGIAFDTKTGDMFATDNSHNCCDRLLRVRQGQNHGWPPGWPRPVRDTGADIAELQKRNPAFVAPLTHSGSVSTGPTKIILYHGEHYGPEFQGNVFYATFHEQSIHRVVLARDGVGVLKDEVILDLASARHTAAISITDVRAGAYPENNETPPLHLIGITAMPDGRVYFSSTSAIYRIDRFGP